MTEDSPEMTTAKALRSLIDSRRTGSKFPAVDGKRINAGTIDDVVHIVAREDPPIDIYELKSKDDGRPGLDVTTVARYSDWLFENLGQPGSLPGFFRRQGTLVRVPRIGEAGWVPPAKGDDGPAQVQPVAAQGLTEIVRQRFWCYREKVETKPEPKSSDGERTIITRRHVLPPKEPAALAVEGISEWYTVPSIRAVTHTQTLREDGSVLSEPGYDEESRILYLPDTLEHTPRWPVNAEGKVRVNVEWRTWSRDVLNLLLQDFPFENEKSRLNALALLITPLLRLVIPPPYPMWIINAHQRGTGKSLLARITRELHGGVHRPELPVDDEEIRKQITSILTTTTAPVINFDNVTQPIGSGQLANLLTTATWSDRPLGRTATVEAANDRIWVCTGNNVVIGGDLGRRVIRVSLDARMEHPELRTKFEIPDIIAYVRSNRGMLLQALLVQVLWWVQRGMPIAEIRSDDYGRWAGAMSEILLGGGLEKDENIMLVDGEERMELVPDAAVGGVRERVVVMSGIFRRSQQTPDEVTTSDEEDELQVLLEMIRDCIGIGVEFQARDLVARAANPAWSELIMDSLPGRVSASKEWWKSLGSFLTKRDKKPAGGMRCEVVATKVRGGNKFVIVVL